MISNPVSNMSSYQMIDVRWKEEVSAFAPSFSQITFTSAPLLFIRCVQWAMKTLGQQRYLGLSTTFHISLPMIWWRETSGFFRKKNGGNALYTGGSAFWTPLGTTTCSRGPLADVQTILTKLTSATSPCTQMTLSCMVGYDTGQGLYDSAWVYIASYRIQVIHTVHMLWFRHASTVGVESTCFYILPYWIDVIKWVKVFRTTSKVVAKIWMSKAQLYMYFKIFVYGSSAVLWL